MPVGAQPGALVGVVGEPVPVRRRRGSVPVEVDRDGQRRGVHPLEHDVGARPLDGVLQGHLPVHELPVCPA